MAVPNAFNVLEQLEREGYFERVREGDDRAASYFVRLAAFRMNPAGSPDGFGCLRKGGGKNIEGYAEDALVYGANPLDFNNVVDCVAGAGARGARLGWGGPVNRRASDTWEAPKELSREQMEYLKTGSGTNPSPTNPPSAPIPPPVVVVPCRYQQQDLTELMSALNAALEQIALARDEAANARAEAKNLSQRLENGLQIEINGGRLIGTLRGTVKG
jgi:hypothetical protein